MKNLIVPLLFLVMASCKTYEAPKLVAPIRAAVHHAQEKVVSAQVHLKTLGNAAAQLVAMLPPQTPEHDLAVQVKAEADKADSDLLEVASQLRDAQTEIIPKLESKVGTMANELAVVNRRYDKLKFGLCTLAAAGALYLLVQFRAILAFAGPYAWIAFVAGPVAIFALCWKVIDWVL